MADRSGIRQGDAFIVLCLSSSNVSVQTRANVRFQYRKRVQNPEPRVMLCVFRAEYLVYCVSPYPSVSCKRLRAGMKEHYGDSDASEVQRSTLVSRPRQIVSAGLPNKLDILCTVCVYLEYHNSQNLRVEHF